MLLPQSKVAKPQYYFLPHTPLHHKVPISVTSSFRFAIATFRGSSRFTFRFDANYMVKPGPMPPGEHNKVESKKLHKLGRFPKLRAAGHAAGAACAAGKAFSLLLDPQKHYCHNHQHENQYKHLKRCKSHHALTQRVQYILTTFVANDMSSLGAIYWLMPWKIHQTIHALGPRGENVLGHNWLQHSQALVHVGNNLNGCHSSSLRTASSLEQEVLLVVPNSTVEDWAKESKQSIPTTSQSLSGYLAHSMGNNRAIWMELGMAKNAHIGLVCNMRMGFAGTCMAICVFCYPAFGTLPISGSSSGKPQQWEVPALGILPQGVHFPASLCDSLHTQ